MLRGEARKHKVAVGGVQRSAHMSSNPRGQSSFSCCCCCWWCWLVYICTRVLDKIHGLYEKSLEEVTVNNAKNVFCDATFVDLSKVSTTVEDNIWCVVSRLLLMMVSNHLIWNQIKLCHTRIAKWLKILWWVQSPSNQLRRGDGRLFSHTTLQLGWTVQLIEVRDFFFIWMTILICVSVCV